MHIGKYCPGCGGGAGNQTCAIARCAIEKKQVGYCYTCESYPCDKYQNCTCFDSFITHQHMLKDAQKAKDIGIEAYVSEQKEKVEILQWLLKNCNDGRRKNFFCIAINLLDINDIRNIMIQIHKVTSDMVDVKDKATFAVSLFQQKADEQGSVLKLIKKPKQK